VKLLGDAKKHVKPRFKAIDAFAKANEMKGAAADDEYQLGEQLMASKTWPGAVAAFQRAEGFVGGPFRDSREKTGAAFIAWSDELTRDGEYRVAAEKAFEASKVDPATARYRDSAAAIHLALGRYFVAQSLCRQGLKDLRRANEIVASAVPLDVLREAEACAEARVAVLPFENRTRERVRGLERNLGDKLAGKVREGASELVRVMERGETRYRVEGKITQLEVERDERPRVAPERITAAFEVGCEVGVTGPCFEEKAVDYQRFEARARLRLAGFVKVVDDTEQLAQVEFDVSDEDAVSFIGNLSIPVEELGGAKLTPEIDLRAQLAARRDLRAEAVMAARLADQVVEAVAAKVIAAVDAEPTANDPRELEIAPLR
jgi:tetratricopeptide (TPR) repeat protein